MTTTALPLLLADSPATSDLLGAHSRVAEGLHDLISSNPGGKTIALEGPWGAGKSTVIELLKKKCSTGDIYVHTHDAWAHEGDPLRRAFLESLMSAMIERKWLEPGEHWRKELQKLALRVKEVTRKSEPSLTGFGKALSVSLLIVPFGIALFGQGLRGQAMVWEIFVGILLGCFPLFLIVGFLIKRWLCNETTTDILAVVLNRTTTEETSSITESVDPTSIEFQAIFSSMLANAVSDERILNPRKIVIVVDNLDRISIEEAAEVWALLRSFLDMPQHKDRKWSECLWVIVPLVDVHQSGENMKTAKTPVGEPHAGKDAVNLTEGFLSKVFQAKFSLPPSTLQNWRACMEGMIKEARLSDEPSERLRVVDLYSAHRSKTGSPTPRELISFINQMVVLKFQWSNQFALLTIAAYVLDSNEVDFAVSLQKQLLPSKTAINFCGTGLSSEYACLYFNTGDVAEALDLLQQPLAEKIISEGNSSGLASEIARAASFALVFSRIIDRDLPALLQRDIAQAFAVSATVLSARIEDTVGVSGALILRELQDKVCEMISRFAWAGPNSPIDVSAAPVVLREYMTRANDDIVAKVILPAIALDANSYSGSEDSKDEDRAGRWMDGFLTMLEDARVRRHVEQLDKPALAPIRSSSFATFVRRCQNGGFDAVAQKVIPYGGIGAVVTGLGTALRAGTIADDDVLLAQWLRCNYPDESTDDLDLAAEERLEDPEAIQPWSVVAHIAFLFLLKGKERSDVLKRLAASGAFANQYALVPGVDEIQAICMLAHVLGAGASAPQSRFGQSPTGWANISGVISDPAAHGSLVSAIRVALDAYGVWDEWADRAAAEPVLRGMTSFLADDRKCLEPYFNSLKVATFRERVDQIGELLDDWLAIRYLAVETRIAGDGDEFSEEVSRLVLVADDAWLLDICIESLDVPPVALIDAAEALVVKLTSEQWGEALAVGGSWELALAEAVTKRRGGRELLGYNLKSPLFDAIRGLSEHASVDEKGDIPRARTLLIPDFRSALDDDVFEYVASANLTLESTFWSVCGRMLTASIESMVDGRKVGRRIFIPLVKRRDPSGLDWLAGLLSTCGPMKALFGDQASLKEFPSALQASLDDATSDIESRALERVKSAFNDARKRKSLSSGPDKGGG
jgi:ABC-type cobalamin/Fe3+-siderophores transport system ATPase subunit